MTTADVTFPRNAEDWFLSRGFPAIVPARARWREPWQRAAPALAAFGLLMGSTLVIALAGQQQAIDIDDGLSNVAEWVIVVVLTVVLPLAVLAAWSASQIRSHRLRWWVSTIATGVSLLSDFFNNEPGEEVYGLTLTLVAIPLLVILSGLGVTAVAGWGIRLTLSQLTTIGALMMRALPLVLLTLLVFFNRHVWLMAADLSTLRMSLVICSMMAIALVFIVDATYQLVRPLQRTVTIEPTDAERLQDTPMGALPDPAETDPLTRSERINVLFVVVVSQFAQLTVVAATAAVMFALFGMTVLTPDVLADWTNAAGGQEATILGRPIPIPRGLIHVAMFQGGLTFMYISARAVTDAEYRSRFVDLFVDDLRLTLVARNRYRARIATP